jgi:hypothetical protein
MTVRLTAEDIQARLFTRIPGEIEARGPDTSAVRLSADSAELLVQYIAALAALGAPFTLDAPAEITDRVRELGLRLTSPPPD